MFNQDTLSHPDKVFHNIASYEPLKESPEKHAST